MMQDSEVIKLVKPVPSDRLATQVLVAWYHAVRPRWKKPLDLAITAFFVLMALYSFSLRPLPLFAWLSLAGALMAIILSWFYVPFLAKAALAANKKVPMYHQEKDYVFHEDYLTFSSKGVAPMNIPYDRFSTLCRTRHALLFLFGKKLVLPAAPSHGCGTAGKRHAQVPESWRGSEGCLLMRRGSPRLPEGRGKFAVSAPFLLSAGRKRVGCFHVTLPWRTGSGGSPRRL